MLIKNNIKIKFFAIICTLAAALFLASGAIAEENFNIIESAVYADIKYEPEIDIKRLCRRLDTSFIYYDTKPVSVNAENPESELAEKIDILFQKAEQILDMYPEGVRAMIVLYKNRKELDEKYYQLHNKKNTSEAFYSKKSQAIYVNTGSITSGILMHEMAHFIIGEYFLISVPDKIQEVLADYTYTHMKD